MFFVLWASTKFNGYAQIQPPGQGKSVFDQNKKDSTQFGKTNTTDWKDESYRIFYRKLYSDKVYLPDSSISTIHRRLVNYPYRDLGNNGSAVRNLLFTAEDRTGPSFGYRAYDVYRYDVDSLNYYNTNRPYSVFGYQLGSKQEQMASLMHTQNIKPNWNFAIGYRKINSPGFYNIQRTNKDMAYLSTHYQSKKLHYELYGGIVYNKMQQDENGGIVDEKQLDSSAYNDRRTIRVGFQNDAFGNAANIRRSSVSNMLRDYSFMVQHGYTWGKTDSIYNADSSKFSLSLTPRFSITHRVEVSGERHLYKDLAADSTRYSQFFTRSLKSTDSIFSRQEWVFIDNRFMLNGFIGKQENQLQFSAGLGIRTDNFSSTYLVSTSKDKQLHNYVIASLRKEALLSGKWFYEAHLLSYVTGNAAGSSAINALLGKDMGKWGSLSVGASQNINAAPYNYTTYYNQYDTILTSFNKESVSQINGQWTVDRWNLSIGAKDYIISNYIYLNSLQLPSQYANTFNIAQVWLRKEFRLGPWVLDNEITYQQTDATAPVNIPQLLGRHRLGIEKYIFKKSMLAATGFETRYHSAYTPAGYSPYFNRFYYQNTYTATNTPELSFYFNFKVKRFRAYLMADQLQQLFSRNTIVAPGYAAQNFMIRFGFNWAMIN